MSTKAKAEENATITRRNFSALGNKRHAAFEQTASIQKAATIFQLTWSTLLLLLLRVSNILGEAQHKKQWLPNLVPMNPQSASQQKKVLHHLPTPSFPQAQLTPSRRPNNPLPNPRTRRLRTRHLVRPRDGIYPPKNSLLPLLPHNRLRKNPPHLRPLQDLRPQMRRHGTLLHKLLHLARRPRHLPRRSIRAARV